MPKLDGLEATRLLAGPDVADPLRVVVVTTFDLDEYVYGALNAGACGFLLKDSGPTLLAEAVRAAAIGNSLVSPSVTVRLLKHLTATQNQPIEPALKPQSPLTERELEARRMQEQALEPVIAHRTVEFALAIQRLRNVRRHGDPAQYGGRGLARPSSLQLRERQLGTRAQVRKPRVQRPEYACEDRGFRSLGTVFRDQGLPDGVLLLLGLQTVGLQLRIHVRSPEFGQRRWIRSAGVQLQRS
jgi:DNA-binding response OmpR family regulator